MSQVRSLDNPDILLWLVYRLQARGNRRRRLQVTLAVDDEDWIVTNDIVTELEAIAKIDGILIHPSLGIAVDWQIIAQLRLLGILHYHGDRSGGALTMTPQARRAMDDGARTVADLERILPPVRLPPS